jgi:flavodoxin
VEKKLKNLVVYYSWTGNTKIVARELADQLNADIRSLKETNERKEGAGFMGAAFGALIGAKSSLQDANYSLEGYDTIFLGTPIWAFHTTPALNTFVKNTDFQNKKVYLFATSSSGKTEKPFRSIGKRVHKKGGTVAGSFFIKTEYNKELELDDVKPRIKEWVTRINRK